MAASASSVGLSDACVTDTRQRCFVLQTTALVPNGPRATVSAAVTCPFASAVTASIDVRLQSPGPVRRPLSAHCTTWSGSPGLNPLAATETRFPSCSRALGVIVTFG